MNIKKQTGVKISAPCCIAIDLQFEESRTQFVLLQCARC